MRDKRRTLVAPASLLPLTSFLLLVLLVAGCHGSPQKQQEQLRQELKSWDATDQLTGELAQRGALPRVYLRQVSEVVEQGRQQVRQREAKSSQ